MSRLRTDRCRCEVTRKSLPLPHLRPFLPAWVLNKVPVDLISVIILRSVVINLSIGTGYVYPSSNYLVVLYHVKVLSLRTAKEIQTSCKDRKGKFLPYSYPVSKFRCKTILRRVRLESRSQRSRHFSPST